jgi:hypothetical protein
MKSTVFWDIMPCSPLKVKRRFGGTNCLHLQGQRIRRARNQSELSLPPAFTLVSCSAYSSTLKIEAICSSQTSVYFQQMTRRYIPEYSTLQLSMYLFKLLHLSGTNNKVHGQLVYSMDFISLSTSFYMFPKFFYLSVRI